ncbi:hypothetical protein BDN72DRAFT_126328 [Pluteus cervinus]|uniref:Uncharacterized protein n=1 Tax=Pluteus cervinus TaxID=181527 RepID=A0ACD3ANG2_9AGAR|nr:hypothetical protein BDN72DRAFT_126328 [Pluteus cervinus]
MVGGTEWNNFFWVRRKASDRSGYRDGWFEWWRSEGGETTKVVVVVSSLFLLSIPSRYLGYNMHSCFFLPSIPLGSFLYWSALVASSDFVSVSPKDNDYCVSFCRRPGTFLALVIDIDRASACPVVIEPERPI